MDRRTLNRIAKDAGVSIMPRQTSGKTRQLYLIKWVKTPDSAPGKGATRNVYLCPEEKIGKLDESTVYAKIAELKERIAALAGPNANSAA